MSEPESLEITKIKIALAMQGIRVAARPLNGATQTAYLLELDSYNDPSLYPAELQYTSKYLVLKTYKNISPSWISAIYSTLSTFESIHGIQTPRIFAVGSHSFINGSKAPWLVIDTCQPFIIYTYVKGQKFTNQISASEVCRIAKALSAFHSTPVNAAPNVNSLPCINLNHIFSSGILDSFTIGNHEILPIQLSKPMRLVTDFIYKHVFEIDLSLRSIVHGDLHLGNLLNGNDYIGIIDVADMAVSSPVIDFMALAATLSHLKNAHKLMDVFFETYSLDGLNTAYTQPQRLALILFRRLMLLRQVTQRVGDIGESLPKIAALYAQVFRHVEQDIKCFDIDFGYRSGF